MGSVSWDRIREMTDMQSFSAEAIALHAAGSSGGAQMYMTCFQLTVTGSGTASPDTVSFPGAYAASDPGILINIYQSMSTYEAPGPTVYSSGTTKSAGGACVNCESTCAATSGASTTTAAAAATTTSKASTTSAAASTFKTSSAAAAATTSSAAKTTAAAAASSSAVTTSVTTQAQAAATTTSQAAAATTTSAQASTSKASGSTCKRRRK